MEPVKDQERVESKDGEPTATPSRETEFLDMNDDCILAILESLKLNDLYSFGSTCVRINGLAGDVFKRKYSDEWVDVEIEPKLKKCIVFKHPNKKAQKYFCKYFRSIRIGTMWNGAELSIIFKLVESNCCPDLKHLQLSLVLGGIYGKYAALIKNQLAQLESIRIEEPAYARPGIYGGMLQYCQNIKCISMCSSRKTYGKEYDDQIELFHGDKHPQLKVVNCFNHVNFMRLVISSVQNLEQLKLEFSWIEDIGIIYDDLKAACDNGTIGQLELILPEFILGNYGRSFGSFYNGICRLAELGPLCALHNTVFDKSQILPIEKLANLTL